MSIFFLDLAHHPDLPATSTARWNNLWRSAGIGVVLLLGANWLIARRLFEPIRRFLAGRARRSRQSSAA